MCVHPEAADCLYLAGKRWSAPACWCTAAPSCLPTASLQKLQDLLQEGVGLVSQSTHAPEAVLMQLQPGDLYIHVSNVKLREAMHQVHPGYVEAMHNHMVEDYMGQVQKADAALLVKDHPPRNIEEDEDAEGEEGGTARSQPQWSVCDLLGMLLPVYKTRCCQARWRI